MSTSINLNSDGKVSEMVDQKLNACDSDERARSGQDPTLSSASAAIHHHQSTRAAATSSTEHDHLYALPVSRLTHNNHVRPRKSSLQLEGTRFTPTLHTRIRVYPISVEPH